MKRLLTKGTVAAMVVLLSLSATVVFPFASSYAFEALETAALLILAAAAGLLVASIEGRLRTIAHKRWVEEIDHQLAE